MRSGARLCIALGLAGVAAGCSGLAGIEDLQLTGSADASASDDGSVLTDATTDSSDASNDVVTPSNDAPTPSSDAARDGTAEAGTDACACMTPPTDCPGSFLICDGFESGPPVDTNVWYGVTSPGSTMVVDGTNPHRGAYSLHIHVDQQTGSSYFQTDIQATQTSKFTNNNPIYVRAFFSLSAPPGNTDTVLIDVGSLANQDSASASLGFSDTGQIKDGVANTDSGLTQYSRTSMVPMPTGAPPGSWICLELGIDTSSQGSWPNGHLQVWDDGGTGPDPLLPGSAAMQPLYNASFGIQFQTPSSPLDLYVDDIAVDTQFIPCDQ